MPWIANIHQCVAISFVNVIETFITDLLFIDIKHKSIVVKYKRD